MRHWVVLESVTIKAACRCAANWPRVALGRGNRMGVFLDFVVFVLMNVFISGMVLLDIKGWPGWAFERAHRWSKRFWLVGLDHLHLRATGLLLLHVCVRLGPQGCETRSGHREPERGGRGPPTD